MTVSERCPCHPADVYGALSRCPACGHWSLDDFCGACERRACGFAVDYRDFDRACQRGYGGDWLDWQLGGHAQDPADWPKKSPKSFPQELKVEGGIAENKGESNRTDTKDTTMNTTTDRTNPTEKQLTLLKTLFAEKAAVPGVTELRTALLDAYRAGTLSRNQASDTISWLMEQKTAKVPAATSTVPAGHYAVASATGTNDLDFYRVDQPTEGKWAGYTFVKRVIGGQEDTPVRGAEAKAALASIAAAGPEAAGQLYGQEIGRCYRCNRHLTDETSRQLGIGPDCRAGR